MTKPKADPGARVGFTPCPDFDLEPMFKLDRELLLPVETDNEIVAQAKRLTLTLSLVFNDLKALSWAAEQLQRGKPEGQAITEYSGQWAGMSDAFARMAHGLLHELGNLIQVNSGLLAWAPLKSINTRLSGSAREAWKAVLDFAKGKKAMKGIGKFMHECRNELAFHYDSKGEVLMAGYRRHFARPRGENAASDDLYVSLGDNMEKSRFFYADAAVIAAQNEKLEQHQVAKAELQRLARDVNEALRFVVGELLVHFKREASQLPRRRG